MLERRLRSCANIDPLFGQVTHIYAEMTTSFIPLANRRRPGQGQQAELAETQEPL